MPISQNTARYPKYCWGCGHQIKDGQKFCTHCGKSVTQKPNEAPVTTSAVKTQPSPSVQETTVNKPIASSPQSPYTTVVTPAETVNYSSPLVTDPTIGTSSPRPTSSPQGRADYGMYGQQQATVTQRITSPSVRSEPTTGQLAPGSFPVVDQLKSLEQTIKSVDIEKRFNVLEYKLNAFNVENRIADLDNKVEKLLTDQNQSASDNASKDALLLSSLSELATKNDLNQYQAQTEQIAKNIVEKQSIINKAQLSSWETRLMNIEKNVTELNSDEKIVNLAKNTITRLTTMEKKLDNFNIEDRTRLIKMDERFGNMDQKMERMNTMLESLVPSLVKLTEKVNQLQIRMTQQISEKEFAPFPSLKAESPPAILQNQSTEKQNLEEPIIEPENNESFSTPEVEEESKPPESRLKKKEVES